MAFVMAGGGAANAFGSEVLACSVDGFPLTANACYGYPQKVNAPNPVTFSPQGLSGAYTYSWTVIGPNGSAITAHCTNYTLACIDSGCGTASYCNIYVPTGFHDKTATATLRLTQSGQTRFITAQATIPEGIY